MGGIIFSQNPVFRGKTKNADGTCAPWRSAISWENVGGRGAPQHQAAEVDANTTMWQDALAPCCGHATPKAGRERGNSVKARERTTFGVESQPAATLAELYEYTSCYVRTGTTRRWLRQTAAHVAVRATFNFPTLDSRELALREVERGDVSPFRKGQRFC